MEIPTLPSIPLFCPSRLPTGTRHRPLPSSAAEDDDLTNGETVFRHSALGGGYASLAQDLTITEQDNDSANFLFSGAPLTVPEGGTASYGVTLSNQPSGNVTITPTVTGDTDITVLPATLTFTTSNWRVSQSFTASAAEDDDLSDGMATIGHTATGGGYAAVTAPVAATEEDNDRGTLVFSPTAVNVPENSSATYTVKLSAKPAATVPVAITRVTPADEDITVSPPASPFPPPPGIPRRLLPSRRPRIWTCRMGRRPFATRLPELSTPASPATLPPPSRTTTRQGSSFQPPM